MTAASGEAGPVTGTSNQSPPPDQAPLPVQTPPPDQSPSLDQALPPNPQSPSNQAPPSNQPSDQAANPERGFRFSALDGLRGVAVLLVLGYGLHGTIARLHPPNPIQYLFTGSFVAIDVLLVLGGFLICRRLIDPVAGVGLTGWLLRRIAGLHLAGWVIALAWFAPALIGNYLGDYHEASNSASTGTLWSWVSSGALLSGFVGPDHAGYPAVWVLSVGLWIGAVLIVLPDIVAGARELLDQLAPVGRTARFGQPAKTDHFHPVGSTRLVAAVAVLAGAALMLSGSDTGLTGDYLSGTAAIGRGLLGLGTGMLTYLALRAATGEVWRPAPNSLGPRRFPAGIGAALATVAVLLCVYRYDLVTAWHLLPIYPVAAALVYFVAQADQGAVHRTLGSRPMQWLGSRAFALFVLHGAILISVEQFSARLNLDLNSGLVNSLILIEVVLGSLGAAEVGHRYLERALAAPTNRQLEEVRPAARIQGGLPANDIPLGNPIQPRTTTPPELVLRPLPSTPDQGTEAVTPDDEPVATEEPLEIPAETPTSPAKTSAARTSAARTSPAKTSPAKTSPARTSPVKNTAAKSNPTKSTAAKSTAAAKTRPTRSKDVDLRKQTVDVRRSTVDLTPDDEPVGTPAAAATPPAEPTNAAPAPAVGERDDDDAG